MQLWLAQDFFQKHKVKKRTSPKLLNDSVKLDINLE